MIRTVTYDDATHVVAPKEPTVEMIAALGWGGDEDLTIGHALISNGIVEEYQAAIAAAPPFTSLPNPDLDVIEQALADFKIDGAVSPIALNKAIAALKRIKGDA